MPFLNNNLLIKNPLHYQIHYNNIFTNKRCRCNEGSLYYGVGMGGVHITPTS